MKSENYSLQLVCLILFTQFQYTLADETIACRQANTNNDSIPTTRCGVDLPAANECSTSGTCVPSAVQLPDGKWSAELVCNGGDSRVVSPLYFTKEKLPAPSTPETGGKAWAVNRRWCVQIYDCARQCELSFTSPPFCIKGDLNEHKTTYLEFFVPVTNNVGTQLDCPPSSVE